jgi:murein DD-endopeptidase MepM/ murein hydrolase activator NlpD
MNTTAHTHRSRRYVLRLALAGAALGLGGYAYSSSYAYGSSAPPTTRARTAAVVRPHAARPYAYGWPVKPFDRPHPVRGSFGDPRMIFDGPPTQATLLGGDGRFSFHQGIDVAAPDGTAVYPVESGTVTTVTREWVGVDSGGGRAFQYWHVRAAVAPGDHVERDATVLGHILRGARHVHLTEVQDGAAVNPLAPGHIGPYEDRTTPTVTTIRFRTSTEDVLPEFVRGRIWLLATAADSPSMPVGGEWNGLPVTPAAVAWRIERADTGRVVVAQRSAWDVRVTLPQESFWSVYARGTHQNMTVFGTHYSYLHPGAYVFQLAPGGFDTTTLRDGVYDLVVTASDVAGNHSSLTSRFTVHNRAGWIGS